MYVFSTFVMRGLNRTDPVDAITAMRGINAEANSNAAFLLAYFGAALLAVVVGVIAAVQLHQPGSWWVLAGAIVGVLAAMITIAFNVPLNNHIDGVNPAGLCGGRRRPRMARLLHDLDGVEPCPNGHGVRRGRADAYRSAISLRRFDIPCLNADAAPAHRAFRDHSRLQRSGRGHRLRVRDVGRAGPRAGRSRWASSPSPGYVNRAADTSRPAHCAHSSPELSPWRSTCRSTNS